MSDGEVPSSTGLPSRICPCGSTAEAIAGSAYIDSSTSKYPGMTEKAGRLEEQLSALMTKVQETVLPLERNYRMLRSELEVVRLDASYGLTFGHLSRKVRKGIQSHFRHRIEFIERALRDLHATVPNPNGAGAMTPKELYATMVEERVAPVDAMKASKGPEAGSEFTNP